jgi:HlyD family secretion protein
MRIWIIAGLVLALGGGGWWATQKWPEKFGLAKGATAAKANARPTTAIVKRRDINFALTAAGEIGPADQVSVRPEINGRIKELPVDIGDDVKAGSLLFALDDSDLQIEKSQRLTEIDGAKLQVERAERNFRRTKELYDAKLVSQEVFDDARTEFDLSKNSLERLQKVLALVEDKLTRTKIMAPFDCTVLTRPVSIGQAVAGTSGMNAGTEVLTIANLNDMVINAHINQADVTRLKEGLQAKVEVEAVPGLTLTGVVERIAPQATIRNNLKGYSTRIQLKNAYGKVRPGMTANLTIPLETAANVVAAPLAAVFTEEAGRFVYVQTGEDQFEKREVRIGVSDFEFVEVEQGLADGDVVSLVLPANATESAVPLAKTAADGKKAAKKKTEAAN